MILNKGDNLVDRLLLNTLNAECLTGDVHISNTGEEYIANPLVCLVRFSLVSFIATSRSACTRVLCSELARLRFALYGGSEIPERVVRVLSHGRQFGSQNTQGHRYHSERS